jgi:hypothetical protein
MDSYCCLKRCSNLWSSLCVFLGIGRDPQMTVSTSTSSIVVAGVCGRLLWYGRAAGHMRAVVLEQKLTSTRESSRVTDKYVRGDRRSAPATES